MLQTLGILRAGIWSILSVYSHHLVPLILGLTKLLWNEKMNEYYFIYTNLRIFPFLKEYFQLSISSWSP